MGGSGGGGIPPLEMMPLEKGRTIEFEKTNGGSYLGLVFNRDNHSKNTHYSVPDEIWIWDDAEALPKKLEDGISLLIMARTQSLTKVSRTPMVMRVKMTESATGDIDRYGYLRGGREDVTFTENGFEEDVPNHGKPIEVKLERGFWWKNGPEIFGNHGFEQALFALRHCYPKEEMTVRVGSDLSRRWQWLHVLERDVFRGRINYFLMAKAWIDLEILHHLGENVDALFNRLRSIIREPRTCYVSLADMYDMDPVYEEFDEEKELEQEGVQ